MDLSLKALATAFNFGPKTIVAIPEPIVRALSIGDGQELEASMTTDGGILLALKGTPKIVNAS